MPMASVRVIRTAASVYRLLRHDLVDPIARDDWTLSGKPLCLIKVVGVDDDVARDGILAERQVVDAVRGEDYAVTERSVDVQIVGLRKKLKDYGKYIETVRGVGYRFRDEE